MKAHTSDFKDQIKLLGRQQNIQIIYSEDGVTITLENEDINSVTPNYQSSLLKSVMKGLDIDSNIIIPEGTEIQFKYGLLVNEEYEYLDYGKYIIYKVEKQEDKDSYLLTCYDKMLYSMKDYEDMNITYPITVRNYINAICNHLGLNFANYNETFANYDKQIPSELYLGIGYTFRDVLDDLAEVTASTICINNNDELEIRYINNTNDTIDEEFLKDINVNFGKKYGPINSVVLSRSGESDNVYLNDPTSIELNGLCEIKIIDNQIMNFNNRSTYLVDILDKVDGIEYYLNDFTSTGIMYYDLLDMYEVSIGENSYNCLMLNDEQDITQGLEEQIFTELPEVSETDYTKADKTDQRINQTYLIVDKQNQSIESVISNVNEQNNKISQINQTVDELNSKISDIADITISGESTFALVQLDNINQSEPILVNIHSTGVTISYLYPNSNLYPSEDLFLRVRTLRFENTETDEIFDYELPDDLLYYSSNVYDEFILNYDSQTCQVVKRCGYNADGSVYALDEEIVTDYPYPIISLTDGDYTISLLGYETGYLNVRLMAQNIYTTQFATKSEVNSEISQTAQSITASVNQKFSNYSTTNEMNSAISISSNGVLSTVNNTLTNYSTTSQMNSAINQTASSITSTVASTYETKTDANNTFATKTQLNTAKSEIKQTTDSISSTVSTKVGNNEVISKINQSSESVSINANRISLNRKNNKYDK